MVPHRLRTPGWSPTAWVGLNTLSLTEIQRSGLPSQATRPGPQEQTPVCPGPGSIFRGPRCVLWETVLWDFFSKLARYRPVVGLMSQSSAPAGADGP